MPWNLLESKIVSYTCENFVFFTVLDKESEFTLKEEIFTEEIFAEFIFAIFTLIHKNFFRKKFSKLINRKNFFRKSFQPFETVWLIDIFFVEK